MMASDFSTILPEIIVSVYAMAALLFGVYTGKDLWHFSMGDTTPEAQVTATVSGRISGSIYWVN